MFLNVSRLQPTKMITSQLLLPPLDIDLVSHTLNWRIDYDARYSDEFFYRIMNDTFSAWSTTESLHQYLVYCRHVVLQESIDRNKRVFCKFDISGKLSAGCPSIRFPMNQIICKFNIHVIKEDVPLLLSLADMDRMKIFYNNHTYQLMHHKSCETTQSKPFYGHSFVRYDSMLQSFFMYTELKHLHKRFTYPHVDKLLNLLKLTELDSDDAGTRSMLTDITRACIPCALYAQAPHLFQFSLRVDKYFYHIVFLDIFYLDSKPILHVVDESTRSQAEHWFLNVTAKSVWCEISFMLDRYLLWFAGHGDTRRWKAVRR